MPNNLWSMRRIEIGGKTDMYKVEIEKKKQTKMRNKVKLNGGMIF